jgi:hypothetical protein
VSSELFKIARHDRAAHLAHCAIKAGFGDNLRKVARKFRL